MKTNQWGTRDWSTTCHHLEGPSARDQHPGAGHSSAGSGATGKVAQTAVLSSESTHLALLGWGHGALKGGAQPPCKPGSAPALTCHSKRRNHPQAGLARTSICPRRNNQHHPLGGPSVTQHRPPEHAALSGGHSSPSSLGLEVPGGHLLQTLVPCDWLLGMWQASSTPRPTPTQVYTRPGPHLPRPTPALSIRSQPRWASEKAPAPRGPLGSVRSMRMGLQGGHSSGESPGHKGMLVGKCHVKRPW